ncbi:hypothetical protein [Cryobacterium sp. Y62]|uniref:hypothetical protein n=1 Tax=Cryobacterium sp. Y62 TaxID=2048284 RepID=UPI000CE333DE|nr:hypothetical protein [Cryobacterium sp. Y62]
MVADVESRTYSDPMDVEDELEFVRTGPESALTVLFDVSGPINATPGIELTSSTVGAFTPEHFRRLHERVDLSTGASDQSSFIGQLIKDSAKARGLFELFGAPESEDEFDVEQSVVLSTLPRRFAQHYDWRFDQKFLVAAVDVTAGISTDLGLRLR